MERGITIGGIVKSRDGKPVAGARVTVMAGRRRCAGLDLRPDVKATTDAARALALRRDAHGLELRLRQGHASRLCPHLMQRDVSIPSDFDLKAKKAETSWMKASRSRDGSSTTMAGPSRGRMSAWGLFAGLGNGITPTLGDGCRRPLPLRSHT